MHVYLPNSAGLGNIEAFSRRLAFDSPEVLHVTSHPKWVNVHPMVLAAVAALGQQVRRSQGTIQNSFHTVASTAYLVRMGLYNYLGIQPPRHIVHHEAAGRFVPLTSVRNSGELSHVLTDLVPLLRSQVQDSYALRYVISELVTNVLEHARSPHGAVVCAQFYPTSNTVALGVADTGIGVRASIAHSYHAPDDRSGLRLALRPGVTGTTTRRGGTDLNAGAGLFFSKALSMISGHHFVIQSGNSMFKLLKSPEQARRRIPIDPEDDKATWRDDMPSWPGTLIGIDIGLGAGLPFDVALRAINQEYGIDVQQQRKNRYKRKPTFE